METRKGTARRADGTAVTGTVRLVRKDGIEIGETRTDAQGRYEFPLSPDLRYALLEPDEGPPAAAPVDEPLVVLPGKPFIGIFSRGGEPAMDVYIRFAPPGLDRSVVARATWPVAPHGTYEGMVPEGAEVWGIRDGIAVKLGLEGQMLPKKVAVSGRVLADDQRPVSGARVSFKPYAEGDFPAPVPPVEVRTNTEGKFALELAQGRYDIRVWHGDFVPESIYEFETGAKPLEVQMERGRFLQGRVQREDGTPIVGARVSVPWKNRHTLAYSSGMRTAMASVSGMRTDRNGRFIVGRFPKTAQHITVSRGDTYQRYDLASLSDPIVLTLSE
ncbi:MAG: carboxypeptidase regulatory-like domain-containing protein, partial [Planctomycetota bacterium]